MTLEEALVIREYYWKQLVMQILCYEIIAKDFDTF